MKKLTNQEIRAAFKAVEPRRADWRGRAFWACPVILGLYAGDRKHVPGALVSGPTRREVNRAIAAARWLDAWNRKHAGMTAPGFRFNHGYNGRSEK